MFEDKQMNYLKIIPETITDGEGIRTSIYVAGCNHKCKGCHNPQTWNFNQGEPLTEEVLRSVVANIKNNSLLYGITFSGGDPLEDGNDIDLLPLLKIIKENNINVWVYTGYTLEEIMLNENKKRCLKYIDTLVDGEFIEDLKDPNLLFRGSSNQKIYQKQFSDKDGSVFIVPKKYC